MKFVIAVDSKAAFPIQINATGHICLAMHRLMNEADMCIREFRDSGSVPVSMLTDHPLIVMSARNRGHLLEAHHIAIANGLACCAFFNCMRTGTPDDQQDHVYSLPYAAQEYIAVGFFGDAERLKPITRRFSLLKDNREEVISHVPA